jgi:uncharacterized protein YabN with tetrapyrrole methylase and pyrophosphatase domain
MVDPNSAVPVISAGATLLAAIVTGFGAAAVKHRWDVKADDLRWQRERKERRRDELKSAFSRYLATLSTVSREMTYASSTRTQAKVDALTDSFYILELAYADIQTVLKSESLEIVLGHWKQVAAWFIECSEKLKVADGKLSPMPSSREIVKLAKKELDV